MSLGGFVYVNNLEGVLYLTAIVKKSSRTVISVFLTLCLIASLMIGIGGFKCQAAILGNDYPYPWEEHSQVDPWRFFKGECTSFVAWRMNRANGIQFDNYSVKGQATHLGNAGEWKSALQKLGYTVDQNP